jgi:hypothetical protein
MIASVSSYEIGVHLIFFLMAVAVVDVHSVRETQTISKFLSLYLFANSAETATVQTVTLFEKDTSATISSQSTLIILTLL